LKKVAIANASTHAHYQLSCAKEGRMKTHGRSRTPNRNLPKAIQIKRIGPTWYWEYHGDGLDCEEMLIDVTAETDSEEWAIKLIISSRTQVEELIAKLRGALAENDEATNTPTEDELHELH
jgi:hypothetical protein